MQKTLPHGCKLALPNGVELAFCPTGRGGGQDPTCGSGGNAATKKFTVLTKAQAKKLTIPKAAALLAERGWQLSNSLTQKVGNDFVTTYQVQKVEKVLRVTTDQIKELLTTDREDF